MECNEILQKLSGTNSRIEKENILKNAWESGNREFFKYFQMCYDNFITFGVKQIPTTDEIRVNTQHFFNTEVLSFDELCEQLSQRKLTGHDARDMIEFVAHSSNPDMWNGFYRYVLMKDMKCGVTDTIMNKFLSSIGTEEAKSFIIPDRSCQLATDYKKVIDKYKGGMKQLDFKYDGVRVYTVFDFVSKQVSMHTRYGLITENFPYIQKKFQDFMDLHPEFLTSKQSGFVIDGEMNGSSFQELMTQLQRKDDAQTDNFFYVVFDIIPLDDFRNGYSIEKQYSRTNVLEDFINTFFPDDSSIRMIEHKVVNMDSEEGRKEFEEFNQRALNEGYEGVMIKDTNAPYECKRTKNWLKLKPFIEVTLKVIGFQEGKKETRLEGTIGALICEGVDSDYPDYIINAEVGSLSDELRAEINANKDSFVGRLLDVRGDILTQNEETKGSNVYSLRFPRFVKWRSFSADDEKI